MLMLSRILEPEVTPRSGLLVRDINVLALTERNVHWSNMAKYVFSGADPQDGLHWADRVYIVYMGPMTIAGPHAHTPEQEEAWVKITDGEALMQLGSEFTVTLPLAPSWSIPNPKLGAPCVSTALPSSPMSFVFVSS